MICKVCVIVRRKQSGENRHKLELEPKMRSLVEIHHILASTVQSSQKRYGLQHVWQKRLAREGDDTSHVLPTLPYTNILFQLLETHKCIREHPCSKLWHLNDYVIKRCRNIQKMHTTRMITRADCRTEQQLVRTKFSNSVVVTNLCSLKIFHQEYIGCKKTHLLI